MSDEPSLVQQRRTIDLWRQIGRMWVIVSAVVLFAVAMFVSFAPGVGVRWTMFVFLVTLGLGQLLYWERRRRQFEAEYGREAGRQEPAGR